MVQVPTEDSGHPEVVPAHVRRVPAGLELGDQEVHERFERILEHWYEIGVDGFRIDVAHGLYKAPGLPNMETFHGNWSACWDQPKVHEVYRRWRRISDRYEPRRFLIGEIHTSSRDRLLEV